MKKLITLLFVSFLLFGCSQKQADPGKIQAKIAKYQKQIDELNEKIRLLKSQLGDTTVETGVKIDTMVITYKPYKHYIEITGSAVAEEDIFVTPEINGQIKQIFVKEGQYVKKGALLVKLKDDLLRSQLAQLETQFYFADTLFQKQKKLYEQNVISEAQFLQSKNQRDVLLKNIEAIKTQLKMTNITAPFSGVVDQIFVKEGQMAAPNVRLLELVNLNSLYAEAFVSEDYLPQIHVGDTVLIGVPLYGDVLEKSKITWISNVIDPNSRTVKIKAQLANKDKKIKPNMTLTVKFADYQSDKAIVIPSAAIIKDLKGFFVYTVKEEQGKKIAKKKYIKIGVSDKDKTVVLSGLKPGDVIVSSGSSLIREGSELYF